MNFNKILSLIVLFTLSLGITSQASANLWDGVRQVNIILYDRAGNATTPVTANIKLDKTLPSHVVVNPVTSLEREKSILNNITDVDLDTAHYELIDASDSCDSSVSFSNSYTPNTQITLSSESLNGKKACFKAVDKASNVSYLASDEIAWIDRTAPEISISYTPELTVSSITRDIKVSVSDAQDASPSLEMATDTSGICDGTLTFWPYSDTSYNDTINDNWKTNCYRSVDSAGNISYSMATITLNTIPTYSTFSKGITHIYSENTDNINFTISDVTDPDDDTISISVEINGDWNWQEVKNVTGPLAWEDYNFTLNNALFSEGNNTVKIKVSDGNHDSTETSLTIFKDSVLPEIAVSSDFNLDPEQTKEIAFTVTDTNTTSNNYVITSSWNDCSLEAYSESYNSLDPITLADESLNWSKVCVKSEDQYWNISYFESKEIQWIDRTAPDLPSDFLLNSGAEFTNANDVNIGITHSDESDVFKWCIYEGNDVPTIDSSSCSIVKPTNYILVD